MKCHAVLLITAFIVAGCGNGEQVSQIDPAKRLETQVEVSQSAAQNQDASPQAESSDPYETSIILTNPDGVTQLTWEDLMPIGEEEQLALLYEEFYAELRDNMEAQSQLLKEAQQNGEAFDVSTVIEGSSADTMEQIGTYNVVDDLDGLDIRLPGYVVPLDFSANGQYDEFLLVPYFGACLHTPPPPPNQIVFVKADPSAEVASIYEPVWVEGKMKTGKFESDTGNSAYELTLSKIEIYEY